MLCGELPRKRVGETAAEGRVVRGLEEDRGGALLGAAMDGWIASLRTSERDELVVGGTGKGRVEGRVVVGRRRAGVARGMNDSVAPQPPRSLGAGRGAGCVVSSRLVPSLPLPPGLVGRLCSLGTEQMSPMHHPDPLFLARLA